MKLDKSGELERSMMPVLSLGVALPVLDAGLDGLVVYVGRRMGAKTSDPEEARRAIEEIAARLKIEGK